jgi:queuine tRNA-ribosyltransferase
MREMRQSILADDFLSYYEAKRFELTRSDEDNPVNRPRKSVKASQPTRLGDYEIHTSAQGYCSIRQISSGEIIHSVNAPDEEANRLYVEQSCLAARLLKQESDRDELVIWDVGLGAAFNAMAVIHCFERSLAIPATQALRRLRLVSFEWDFDPLLLALGFPNRFPHLRHGAPFHILETGQWKHASNLLEWELLKGDFRDFIESAKIPEIIFYDPFSYKTDAALWTVQTFERILNHCLNEPAELYTYSASTTLRVALLTAGFFVAQGIGTGPKSDTTIAFASPSGSKDHPLSPQLLGRSWLTRWRRSGAKFPATVREEDKPDFEKLIESHPQFALNHS